MSFAAVATAAVSIGGTLLSSRSQSRAAENAADAQSESNALAIAEQSRQFDAAQRVLQPFVDQGSQAFAMMADFTGLNGQEAYRTAIQGVEQSPELQARIESGEEAILANASATGGLRGGNTQGALAQFRPQMLAEQIATEYNRLGGLSQMGQASAAGQASAGLQVGQTIGQLHQSTGAAQAGSYLAQGQAQGNAISGITGILAGAINGGF